MRPRRVEQAAPFHKFSLDEHVPADHPLRAIARFVDPTGLRRDLAPFCASTGRPAVDPESMIRTRLVGDCFGIRSARRPCEAIHLGLAHRRVCRLGLDGRDRTARPVPPAGLREPASPRPAPRARAGAGPRS